jgi:two-component system sensor histidine kinase/response regulator
MRETSRSRVWAAYGATLAVFGAGVVVRWQLGTTLGDRALYSIFLPAVLVAAYFGGLWPGFLVTLLCTLTANMMVEPRLTLGLKGPGDALAMLLFVVTGAIISALSESLHRARQRVLAEERGRADQLVKETEERFRQVAENILEIFWVADLGHTRIMYVTPRLRRSLGPHDAESVRPAANVV